jgi:iron complex transport system ATP-binding protein
MIRFQHTEIGYHRPLLAIEDLHLQKGKVYALLGLNGSGKSTLLKTLAAQIPVLSGNLLINDFIVEELAQNANLRAQQIAFVSSRFEGVEHLSVADYVGLGRIPYASIFGKLTADDRQLVHDTLEKLGLSYLSEKRTLELSDGERQMVSLARAFVQDTPVLLLDEPASFLDFLNREQLLRTLIPWAMHTNRCVVLSSHDLDLCIEHDLPLLLLAQQKLNVVQGLSKRDVQQLLIEKA